MTKKRIFNKTVTYISELIVSFIKALTLFKKEKWIEGKYEIIEVLLSRDPVLGLGITLVGYVHSKGWFFNNFAVLPQKTCVFFADFSQKFVLRLKRLSL